jgi:hypothetical protein
MHHAQADQLHYQASELSVADRLEQEAAIRRQNATGHAGGLGGVGGVGHTGQSGVGHSGVTGSGATHGTGRY